MKLLFTKRGYSPVGGSESLCYQFATRLALRGHDVRVVCAWPTDKEEIRYPARRYRPLTFDDHRVFRDEHGVEVVQVRPRGGLLGMAADATTLVDLMRGDILERYASDREVIHNVGREYLGSSLEVAEELDLPIVLTPLAHPGQFHGGDSAADIARYRTASAITTMTDWERSWYIGHGVDPTRVVTTGMGPNAVRSADGRAWRRRRGIPDDAPIVLYIGRKERYKGYIQLLDSAELVWAKHHETRYVFIGIAGFYSTFIDDFVRYTDDRILHIEGASGEEKSAALDACDVFAMPSQHETFGLGYLEAWLHRKPVIGCDIPPMREVIGEHGLLVPQRPVELADAIVRLIEDPELRRAMGEGGQAKVRERWDWDRVMDRVESTYERALAGAPADATASATLAFGDEAAAIA
ncbi:MAG TPA: glycosyltransferase family 4 protein [Candidatus Limnocylindria bacterium]|nr:glycosyltransferase family 4 protein [Candidatus Limnocylindria bacterium]